MSRPPLSKERLEPEMTETVEITELYGKMPGGIFDFIGYDFQPKTIETSWGDLRIIVDVLVDYADILDSVIDEWGLVDGQEILYRFHAVRCRKIAQKYARDIDYDREAAFAKCRKWKDEADDVGDDAMELFMKQNRKKAGKSGTQRQNLGRTAARQEAAAIQLSLF